jgi:hypothetical protein
MHKIIIPIFLMIIAIPVMAGLPSLVPEECLGDATGCNLGSVETLAANVAGIILGISGSIALLMFVIGGFMYMFSGGSQERVSLATKILSTSVIGLALILGAGVIIKFVLKALQGA